MAKNKTSQANSAGVPRPTKWSKGNQVYLGQELYLSYLKSSKWSQKKKQYKRSGFKLDCWACDSTLNIQYHHRTYGRLGWEALSDIIPLCKNCHEDLTEQYKSKEFKNANHIWIETTEYIKNKRNSLSLFPMPERLFSLKLITNPHNSSKKIIKTKPEKNIKTSNTQNNLIVARKKKKKNKGPKPPRPDYSTMKRKKSTDDPYGGLPIVRKTND